MGYPHDYGYRRQWEVAGARARGLEEGPAAISYCEAKYYGVNRCSTVRAQEFSTQPEAALILLYP